MRGKRLTGKEIISRRLLLLAGVVALMALSFTSCGGGKVVSRNVESIFEEGILPPVDLSFSPLDELALPTAELEIAPIELPDMDMVIDIGIDAPGLAR